MTPGLTAGHGGESRSLTGLRGIGALLVMCHHFYLHAGIASGVPSGIWPGIEGVLRRGYLGVDLFFVLSGFVLSMVYGAWFADGGGMRRMPVFLVRRVARLWPLHAAVLVAVLALQAAAGGPEPGAHVLLSNFAMVQAWGFSTEINAPAWSVSTEFMAYLLFPLLAPLVLRSRMGVLLGLACVAAALAVCLAMAPPLGPARRGWLDIYYNYSPLPALRSLAGFILGMATWAAGTEAPVRRLFAQAWAALWVGPTALLLVLCLLLGRANDLLIYPLLPVVVLGFHHGSGMVWRAVATGPLYRLGMLSYAVYLIHFVLLTRFPFDWGPFWEMLTAYLAITLGIAVLAHRLVELPGRALFRRIGERAAALVGMGLAPLTDGPPLRDERR